MSILEMQMWVYNPKYKKYISERGNVVMEKEIIGRQIKELRICANMTLEQLAEILDVSKCTLQRYESGEADTRYAGSDSTGRFVWFFGQTIL